MEFPIVMGIDPSSKTGLVIIQGDEVLHRATLRSDREDYVQKGVDIGLEILGLVSIHEVTHINIEDYALNARFRLPDMVKVGTTIRLIVHRNTPLVPMYNTPPTTLKKWATLKGSATKADMKRHCKRRFGFEGNNDEIDAFLLAKYLDLGVREELTLKSDFWTPLY